MYPLDPIHQQRTDSLLPEAAALSAGGARSHESVHRRRPTIITNRGHIVGSVLGDSVGDSFGDSVGDSCSNSFSNSFGNSVGKLTRRWY
jgi:hypothetical protein